MLKILITGGPTNEYIDDVMKITNMATGGTALELAGRFSSFADVTIIGSQVLQNNHLFNSVRLIPIETTAEMAAALENEKDGNYDMVVHSAAVGDYAPEFTFLLEDMAKELYTFIKNQKDKNKITEQDIFNILKNPKHKIESDTKISSTQENLTVKLTLTPKIINNLRKWYPKAVIIGFKLLSNVSPQELYQAATKLCQTANIDYVIANDLHEMRCGFRNAHLVTKSGYQNQDFDSNSEIFEFLDSLLRKRK